ncbi:MAG: flagellar basal body P-ring formation chaperone FlgA [Rhizobacter sp.]
MSPLLHLLAGLALLFGLAAPARALGLRLHEQAEVQHAAYTLGEIAEVADSDAAKRARLAALTIGQAPRQGQGAQIITREAVETLLRRLGALTEAPAWSGAEQVVVRQRGTPLDTQKVADAAALALFGAWAPSLNGLEARIVGEVPPVSLPEGAVAMQARLPANAALARRMLVHVDVTVEGQPVTTLPVWFAVRALRPVRLARVALKPGEALRDDAFVEAVRDVTAYPSPPLPADAPLAGLRLRVPLEADMALGAAQVEGRPAVLRNEPVQVRVQLGPVQLDTVGVALADGRIGERVRVMNPASQDAFSARVVAEGAVLAEGR